MKKFLMCKEKHSSLVSGQAVTSTLRCIKIVAIKRRYTTAGSSSRRSQSCVYYVQSTSGMSVRVCRKAFLHIHDVSGGRVDCALKLSVAANGSPQMDK